MDGWDCILKLTSGAIDRGAEGERLLCVGSRATQGPRVGHY